MSPELMTVAAAAKKFSVGRATIFRYLHAGKLTRYQRGMADRRTYVDGREIKRLLTFQKKEVEA